MNPLDEYAMLMDVYEDTKSVIKKISSDDRPTYIAMYDNVDRVYKDLKKDHPEEASMLQDYLNFIHTLLNNDETKMQLGLVEKGTNAGNQAEKLGTARGFVARCPECTFPVQRCKC